MEKGRYNRTIKIAEKEIRCSFRHEKTASFFEEFIVEDKENKEEPVEIDQYDEELWERTGRELDGHAEYSLLCGGVSDYLMEHGSMLMHAVAFRYRDRAYLIMAGPGVGKSTQIRFLMDLYPGEFSVICGDRPCLKFLEDGRIMVYPTPWNGKEGWGGSKECELKAVFYLKRGEETQIRKMSEKEAVIPVFSSVISRREEEETIRHIGKYTEAIIKRFPVYHYINGGVPVSTRILYDNIRKEVCEDEV